MTRFSLWLPVLLAVLVLTPSVLIGQDSEHERPSLSFRATPPVGFTPLRVRFVVELRGGHDDHPDYYCPEVEWEWGDGTRSESARDCEPYVEGVSQIARRYTAEHTYRNSGSFRARFRLRQNDDIVESADIRVQARRGSGGF